MMETINCPLCQADDAPDLMSVYDWYNGNGGPFMFVRCRRCGLTYLNPRPSGTELLSYNKTMWDRWSISDQSTENIGSPQTALNTYREIITELNKRKPDKGKLLEVGCGEGGFLKVCQAQGWDVYGLDISEESIAYVKTVHGIEHAYVAGLLGAGFNDDQFDVVIFNHLIEHLTEPKKYLQETNRILKPQGILCISTPNIDSLSARVFGKYWQALLVPLHLVLFSTTTLSKLLQDTSFTDIDVSHFSHTTNAYILLRSLACIMSLIFRKNKIPVSRNEYTVETTTSKDKKEPLIRVIYRYLRPTLDLIISPIIFVEGAMKHSSSITIYATPIKGLQL
jgi:2-polyprenyl-3-methyl-5-hydroxy-6-metoxy-1,4-benzoquinol methylase